MRRISTLPMLVAAVALAASSAQAQWTVHDVTVGRHIPAAISADGKVVIASGLVVQVPSDAVDIYDDASGTWSEDHLSVARAGIAATVVGHYALFAGGTPDGTTSSDVVDVLDLQTMTWLAPAAALSQARHALSAATVGDRAIFAGGFSGAAPSDVVDVYDASLGLPNDAGAWTSTTLVAARGQLAAASVGNVALFVGGSNGVATVDTVDAYDGGTGTWTSTALSQARSSLAATTAGTRAYFGGGFVAAGTASDRIDVYDASLGGPTDPAAWTTITLPTARYNVAATSLGNIVLFAGGVVPGAGATDAVDMLDVGTGHWDSSQVLSQARAGACAASVGGKALIALGSAGFGSPSSVVDIYEPLGIHYCSATPNSTGNAATITADGSPSLAANDVVLTAVDVPESTYLFLRGSAQNAIPFGDGLLCIGGTITRVQPAGHGTNHVAQTTVDLPTIGITTPGVQYFQCWFRDIAAGGAGFNTSDAIAITFVP